MMDTIQMVPLASFSLPPLPLHSITLSKGILISGIRSGYKVFFLVSLSSQLSRFYRQDTYLYISLSPFLSLFSSLGNSKHGHKCESSCLRKGEVERIFYCGNFSLHLIFTSKQDTFTTAKYNATEKQIAHNSDQKIFPFTPCRELCLRNNIFY